MLPHREGLGQPSWEREDAILYKKNIACCNLCAMNRHLDSTRLEMQSLGTEVNSSFSHGPQDAEPQKKQQINWQCNSFQLFTLKNKRVKANRIKKLGFEGESTRRKINVENIFLYALIITFLVMQYARKSLNREESQEEKHKWTFITNSNLPSKKFQDN